MIRSSLFVIIVFFIACNNPSKVETKIKQWQLGPFYKDEDVNPILVPDMNGKFIDPILKKSVQWESRDVYNPAAMIRKDTIYLLYRAQDSIGTSRIGVAWSKDGLHFLKFPNPVLYPDNDELKKFEWKGGCEDPRVVQDENGNYFMTYTAYDGDKARLMIASSTDLFHWKKHGHVFAKAYDGKYVNTWSKSGSIVSKYINGYPVAVKIGGKYWMYWGDTNIFLASSDDLINWTPIEEKPSVLKVVFMPRKGKFDSDLIEPGPPAILIDEGILLIYNSRNVRSKGDSSLPDGTYTAGQVLIDGSDPSKVMERSENYFLKPDKPYELTGQVNNVCFLEGLVRFRDRWFLYYGTADSKIAVAVKKS